MDEKNVDTKDAKVVESQEVIDLKTEFGSIVNEMNAMNEKITEKRTRLVEIQGVLKYIEGNTPVVKT